MVREFLIGDNPFIGVSHLAQIKAREESREATLERKYQVLRKGVEAGATGFTFSTHNSNLELLKYVKEKDPELIGNMNYHILVPYAQSYVRKANIHGTIGLLKDTIKELLRNFPIQSFSAAIKLDYGKGLALFLALDLVPYLKILPRKKIKSILLHEVLTEVIIAFDLSKLLVSIKKFIEGKMSIDFGVETRNITKLEDFLNRNNIMLKYIMTPMNPLGYQMATDKLSAEESILRLSKKSNIIAINTLASGAVSLDESIKYLKKYKEQIYAVTSASTKPYRIYDNFKKLVAELVTY